MSLATVDPIRDAASLEGMLLDKLILLLTVVGSLSCAIGLYLVRECSFRFFGLA